MDMFIAPKAGEYKTVSPALATKLIKAFDARILDDGRIACGDGYITCELPKLNASEERAARVHHMYRSKYESHAAASYDSKTPEAMTAFHHYDAADYMLRSIYEATPLKLAAILVHAAAQTFVYAI